MRELINKYLELLSNDIENDESLNLRIFSYYDEEYDTIYIHHDNKSKNFNEDETEALNTHLIKHLDDNGFTNYSFGYDSMVENLFVSRNFTLHFDASTHTSEANKNRIRDEFNPFQTASNIRLDSFIENVKTNRIKNVERKSTFEYAIKLDVQSNPNHERNDLSKCA